MLPRVLDRLDRQDAGPDAFEVVIGADAAERDVAAVQAVTEGRPYAIRAVQAATPGVSAARNRALAEARHPLVLFIGDDMLPAPDLVTRHLEHHRRHPEPEWGLIGHVRWARELKMTPFMQWLDAGIQFGFGSIPGSDASWWHFVAANGSLKTEFLERVGGFDENFRFGYEEMDLAYRLHQIGLRLRYDARAEVEHLHRPTIDGWRRRMRTVAPAERRFVAKHPGMEPYFLPIFERAMSVPPLRGRAARVARVVPRWVPKAGPWIWHRADLWFAQQLAPSFLEAWRVDAAAQSPELRGVKPSGSPPGGP